MINDEEWSGFEEWWHSQWTYGCPKRFEIELFLAWREVNITKTNWRWEKSKPKDVL